MNNLLFWPNQLLLTRKWSKLSNRQISFSSRKLLTMVIQPIALSKWKSICFLITLKDIRKLIKISSISMPFYKYASKYSSTWSRFMKRDIPTTISNWTALWSLQTDTLYSTTSANCNLWMKMQNLRRQVSRWTICLEASTIFFIFLVAEKMI